MTQQHLITPPPELVQQWVAEIWHEGTPVRVSLSDEHIATRAAQWGADRQLEADAEWLDRNSLDAPHLTITPTGKGLVEAMRPKPPSLKEQALQALSHLLDGAAHSMDTKEPADYIRRALEQLDD